MFYFKNEKEKPLLRLELKFIAYKAIVLTIKLKRRKIS